MWILKLVMFEFFVIGIFAIGERNWWLALYGLSAAALQLSILGGMK